MTTYYQARKVGVLGGGQLGRMLIQAGIDLNIDFAVLDPDPEAPCSRLAAFTCGKLTDYKTVMDFGQQADILTIEIENVNTAALKDLEAEGKKVYPQPHVIEMIQDKRLQKQFYVDKGIPTSPFVLTSNKHDVERYASMLPAVNKLGREGYDGRGVQVIRDKRDLSKAFDAPGLLEKLVDFEKELAVIVARNAQGHVSCFPAVEMVFHPEANLVEYLLSPAQVSDAIQRKAEDVAIKVVTALEMVGILAVEMFLTRDGEILVNEIAPRPHNSGHQTIEANITSQYEQHLRAILDLPLGNTDVIIPSVMVNLLGEEGHSGPAQYAGLKEVLGVAGIHVHLYGKKMTKGFRKMGHVTIVDDDIDELRKKIDFVKRTLRVTAS